MAKFLIYICRMGDLILLAALLAVLYFMSHLNLLGLIVVGILVIGSFKVWKSQGGLTAWRKADNQKFIENWNKMNG